MHLHWYQNIIFAMVCLLHHIKELQTSISLVTDQLNNTFINYGCQQLLTGSQGHYPFNVCYIPFACLFITN